MHQDCEKLKEKLVSASVIFPFKECCTVIENNWVDIYYRVANPSIWMYYLPDPDTNRVSFVYM